jgi:hypothetical protein
VTGSMRGFVGLGTCPSDLPVKNTPYDTKVWHDFPKGRSINATAIL